MAASGTVKGRDVLPGGPPRYSRPLSDKILIAFHHACDQADYEVAEQLLLTMELMLTRRPMQHDLGRRRTMESLIAAARKRLIACKERQKLIVEITAEPEDAANSMKLIAKAEAEVDQGPGLGRVLSPAEGRARIAEYATPTKVEDWAGPLAGPTELERDFGVARSTLHTWQKQGAVIGLLVGVRKHAFPTEQFVDGRPVTGLGEIVAAVGDPRTAWLWLREPNPGLAGATPLARLKAGATEKVVGIARSNFAEA